jgi:hypothetical protein
MSNVNKDSQIRSIETADSNAPCLEATNPLFFRYFPAGVETVEVENCVEDKSVAA